MISSNLTLRIARMLETGLMNKWLTDTLLEHEHRAFLKRQLKQKWETHTSALNNGAETKPQKTAAEMEAMNIHNFRIDEFEAAFILYFSGNTAAIIWFSLCIFWRQVNIKPNLLLKSLL